MIFIRILFLLSVSALHLSPILGEGRRPQTIEHNFCSLMYADILEHAKTIDSRANVQAYNIGQNGSLCMTTCRIVSRGNVKPLDAHPSPDFIRCSAGPQYCYKGSCTNEKDLGKLLKKNGHSYP